MVEYALILLLMALVCIVGLTAVGVEVLELWDTIDVVIVGALGGG